MGMESPSPAQGLERNKKYSRYVGLETPTITTDLINQFLAAHPITAEDPIVHTSGITGELFAVDTLTELDRIGLETIARDCDAVIEAAAPFALKREVCLAKIETVVRMQNPELATEEVIVFRKAQEKDDEFEDEQARLYREHEMSLDELSAMDNPADELLQAFQDHLETSYDLPQLQLKARSVLTMFMQPQHIRDFETLVDLERVDDPTRIKAFGASVTAHVVMLENLR